MPNTFFLGPRASSPSLRHPEPSVTWAHCSDANSAQASHVQSHILIVSLLSLLPDMMVHVIPPSWNPPSPLVLALSKSSTFQGLALDVPSQRTSGKLRPRRVSYCAVGARGGQRWTPVSQLIVRSFIWMIFVQDLHCVRPRAWLHSILASSQRLVSQTSLPLIYLEAGKVFELTVRSVGFPTWSHWVSLVSEIRCVLVFILRKRPPVCIALGKT